MGLRNHNSMDGQRRWMCMGGAGLLLKVGGLVGCAPGPALVADSAVWERNSQVPAGGSGWSEQRFPGKRSNHIRQTVHRGRPALEVQSQSALSVFRHRLDRPIRGLDLSFSWTTDQLLDGTDLAQRHRDDAVARLVVALAGDRSQWTARDHALSDLAHTLTGEPMPDATLMYVWAAQGQVGDVVSNPRTGRIRSLVLQAGAERLGRWTDHVRDLTGDVSQVFGAGAWRIQGVALMTDTDNTGGEARAWYGPVRLGLG